MLARPAQVVHVIGLEISIRIGAERRKEFLEFFQAFSRTRNNRIQRIELVLLENVSMPNSFVWMERWDSEDALVEYMNSDWFHTLMDLVDTLGTLQDLRIVESLTAQDWSA